MSSPTIHGEFLISPNDIPSLIYQLPQNQITRGSFRHKSIAVDWLIIPVLTDQGNTVTESLHGITVEWDFRTVSNKPEYIAVIAGYEMPENMNLLTTVDAQSVNIECPNDADPFFYIALANQAMPNPEDNAGDWPSVTIKIDVSPSTFENEKVKTDNSWELYYLPSNEELVSNQPIMVNKVAQRVGTSFEIVTPATGNVSGRYIFGRIPSTVSMPQPPTNVNTASKTALEQLPGIGPSLAQKIIDGRPYTTIDDLDRVSGIGPSLLAEIRALITV